MLEVINKQNTLQNHVGAGLVSARKNRNKSHAIAISSKNFIIKIIKYG